eukprot:768662-Hanusia_phi.AAC.2
MSDPCLVLLLLSIPSCPVIRSLRPSPLSPLSTLRPPPHSSSPPPCSSHSPAGQRLPRPVSSSPSPSWSPPCSRRFLVNFCAGELAGRDASDCESTPARLHLHVCLLHCQDQPVRWVDLEACGRVGRKEEGEEGQGGECTIEMNSVNMVVVHVRTRPKTRDLSSIPECFSASCIFSTAIPLHLKSAAASASTCALKLAALLGVTRVGLGRAVGDTRSLAKVLVDLTGLEGSAEEDAVGAGGGAEGQLVEGDDLSSSSGDASTGPVCDAEAADGELEVVVLEEADVVGDGSDHHSHLALLALHELGEPGDGEGRTVGAAHEEALQDDSVELGVGPASEKPVELRRKISGNQNTRVEERIEERRWRSRGKATCEGSARFNRG